MEFGTVAICRTIFGNYIEGRCYEGTIRIGDVFDCVFDYERPPSLEAAGDKQARTNEQAVNLGVERITWYGTEAQSLVAGDTGLIYLTGKGFELLKPRCVLGMRQSE